MQNYHPLFVHFPIALLVLAAGSELAFLLTHRPLADALSRWFLYLGTLAAAAAATSGWFGLDDVAPVAAAKGDIVTHRALGFITLGTAALLTFWRWGTARAGGPRPRPLFSFGLLGLAALVCATALEGGELVYAHGVGTELTAPGGPLAEPPDTAASRRPEVPKSEDFR